MGLSDHYTYKKLLRFTLPSIIMMIFTSIYGIVDGIFVSNFVGKTAFTAVNFIFPFVMILATIGFMLGTGGSALVAKTMGEGDHKKANEIFSLIVYSSVFLGIVFTVIGIFSVRPIAMFLGAEEEMLEECVIYGRIILLSLPAFVLQLEFQSFFVTAEKPSLGLRMTVITGCANMGLDALLVGVFGFGLEGAAAATAISQSIGGIVPIVYFSRKNTSLLKLTKTKLYFKAFIKAATNGSSEFMNNISMSVVSMLYNAQLLKYAGENGVAAYGVIMYVSMVFASVFIGYSIGSAPIVSYNFGAQNHMELKNLFGKSFKIIGLFSVAMIAVSELFASPLSYIFTSYDDALLEMTSQALRIYSISYLFMGFSIYSSGFFTALNDGFTSAVISFMRTLVFQVAFVMILPIFFDLDGIWYSIPAAELTSLMLSAFFLAIKKKKFNY